MVCPSHSKSTKPSLAKVSVVRIALAKKEPALASLDNFGTVVLIPSTTSSVGKGSPIKPVEATITSSGEIFKAAATVSAMASAPSLPCSPVHALAFPALHTIT